MREMKIDPSVESIAQHYSELIDVLVIDHKDAKLPTNNRFNDLYS